MLVTGVFATPDDLYPRLDPARSSLMLSQESFMERFTDQMLGSWYVMPDLSGVSTGDLAGLARGGRAPARPAQGSPGPAPTARSGRSCSAYLGQLDRSALVGQSTMLVPVLQLLILAGYSLMLTARMLADRRRMEVALLRARGAAWEGWCRSA
ncbi:hypothetical protein GCM10020219_006790 [Nonomuraea dietziae]